MERARRRSEAQSFGEEEEDDGNSAILAAVEEGNIKLVEQLLANGADDANSQNKAGCSARFIAISQGRANIAALLRDSGAVLSPEDEELA